jgi:DNA-binding response OmpR family regulator
MDCQMPEMDGFNATVEIRRREAAAGRHTPIVALTASVVEDGRERCRAVGMDHYLAKPFTLEQMRAMLDTWLTLPEQPEPTRLSSLPPRRPLPTGSMTGCSRLYANFKGMDGPTSCRK